MNVVEPSANVEQKIVVLVLAALRYGGPIKPCTSKPSPIDGHAQREFG